MKNRHRIAELLASLVVFTLSTSFGQTVWGVFEGYPSLDMHYTASSNSLATNTNYITLGSVGSTQYWGFIKFDLSSIPKGASILNARLYLYPNPMMTNQSVSLNLYRADTAWNETTSRYLNPVIYGTFVSSITLNQSSGYNGDVRDMASYWLNTSNNGLVLTPSGFYYGLFYLQSRESAYYGASYAKMPKLYVEYQYTKPSFKIGFPVKGVTSKTVTVESVIDWDSTPGKFRTTDGQTSSVIETASNLPQAKGVWTLPFKYNTTVSLNNKNVSRPDLLAYDNHDGYDFALKGSFVAPANGRVFLGLKSGETSSEGYTNKSGVEPPMGKAWWSSTHAIYIDHGNGYISYSYHCNPLSSTVAAAIKKQGFCDVKKGQIIASISGFMNYSSKGGPTHLHFGIYKDGSLVDPYGDWKGNNILWDQ